MSVVDVIARAKALEYQDEDGEKLEANFLPGLDGAAIEAIESGLGAPLPKDYRELLGVCSGIEGLQIEIDFRGPPGVGLSVLIAHGMPFATDGYGNDWAVDCLSIAEDKAQVYYLSHDPPVMLYQCDGMEQFVDELIRYCQPPNRSLIDDVHEDRIFEVWTKNPAEQATGQDDVVLRTFKEQLGDGWVVADMRKAKPGQGFSWGRYGARTELRRFGDERVFAYARPAKKQGIFAKLFGGG